MNHDRVELPEATVQLQQQLERWRATRPVRARPAKGSWKTPISQYHHLTSGRKG
jgi:hypothetical protein